MSKEKFKLFAQDHPKLAQAVANHKASWQELYELYDLYGEEASVWQNYLKADNGTNNNFIDTFSSIFKNVDVKQIQTGIGNIQKALGLVSDLFIKDDVVAEEKVSTYIPRAGNRKFDD